MPKPQAKLTDIELQMISIRDAYFAIENFSGERAIQNHPVESNPKMELEFAKKYINLLFNILELRINDGLSKIEMNGIIIAIGYNFERLLENKYGT